MTDPQSISDGLGRTSELAKLGIGFLMFGIGVGLGASLFATLHIPVSRIPKSNTRTRCNWHGQPMVDDGGCADVP